MDERLIQGSTDTPGTALLTTSPFPLQVLPSQARQTTNLCLIKSAIATTYPDWVLFTQMRHSWPNLMEKCSSNTALVNLQTDKAPKVCTEKVIFLSSDMSGAVLTLHILQADKVTAG